MKAKAMFKYISKNIAVRWMPVMLAAVVFGVMLSFSDFRSAKRDTDDLIEKYGTYEQIPEEELDNVDDFSTSIGMMYIVIVSISSSAFALQLFGLTMQMSSTRRTMRRVYLAAMAELAVLGGLIYWLLQTVLYRLYASNAGDKYPRLREECLEYTGPKYLWFFLLTGLAAAAAGAFFAMLISRNKAAGIILGFLFYIGAVVGGILLYFYTGTLPAILVSAGMAVLFMALSSVAINRLSLENNLFKTARR
ncbi:MAG: hypothetical protein IJ746_02525 [Ruminococcus sp.]|nr:hypothetical protein [Ruminococcus sp.]